MMWFLPVACVLVPLVATVAQFWGLASLSASSVGAAFAAVGLLGLPQWYWFRDDGVYELRGFPWARPVGRIVAADELESWRPASRLNGPALVIRTRQGKDVWLAYSPSQRKSDAEGAVFDWFDARAGRLWYPEDDE